MRSFGTQKQKIVILTNLFPNPTDANRGVFTLQIALQLKKICDIRVVCPIPYFPKMEALKRFGQWYDFSQIPNQYSINGISVYSPKYFIIPRISEFIHAILVYLPVLHTLKALKHKEGVDLVNAHWLYPDGASATWACQQLGIPSVLTALGCDVNFYAEKPLIDWQIKYAVRQCNAVTTVSEDLTEKIKKWGIRQDNPFTIPNGVDLSLFKVSDKRRCRRSLSIPENVKLILFVGRLSEEKGFDILIKSIKLIIDRRQGKIRVAVLGNGPLKQFYEQQIEKMGLSNIFWFKGFQKHSSVPIWLGASDLLSLPSIREGCPNVVLEALGAGRPVVAANVGGVPETVIHGLNGFLFEAGKTEQLANRLEQALSTHWDTHSLQQSIAKRSWEEVAKQYKLVFDDVLSKC